MHKQKGNKIQRKRGNIWGGYTNITWKCDKAGDIQLRQKNGLSFIFVLNGIDNLSQKLIKNPKIYRLKGSSEIYCCDKQGPHFGNGADICVYHGPHNSCVNNAGAYETFNPGHLAGNKSYQWMPLDYEVFAIKDCFKKN